MNLRRTARGLDGAAIWSPWVLRLRASRLKPVRYKPERRVVFQLEARLRGAADERDLRLLGVRVLAPEVAARVASHRQALDAEFVPRLLHTELEAGVLVEDWLPGSVPAPDDYSGGLEAGRLLARLHGLPLERLPPGGPSLRGFEPLEIDPRLARQVALLPPIPAATPAVMVHGDLHPDQVLEHKGDRFLLDLDTLRAGTGEEDLASWVGGHLADQPDLTFEAAAGELLEGYRHAGGLVNLTRLRIMVVHELAARAAGGIRRLERDALAKAGRLLELSRAVGSPGGPA
jgi:phosphotransferase family enzyme